MGAIDYSLLAGAEGFKPEEASAAELSEFASTASELSSSSSSSSDEESEVPAAASMPATRSAPSKWNPNTVPSQVSWLYRSRECIRTCAYCHLFDCLLAALLLSLQLIEPSLPSPTCSQTRSHPLEMCCNMCTITSTTRTTGPQRLAMAAYRRAPPFATPGNPQRPPRSRKAHGL